jgi:hypothetical protein
VIAVGRCREAASHSGLKVMFAHKTTNLLVIDDHALLPEGGLDPPPAIVLELIANSSHAATMLVSSAARIRSS